MQTIVAICFAAMLGGFSHYAAANAANPPATLVQQVQGQFMLDSTISPTVYYVAQAVERRQTNGEVIVDVEGDPLYQLAYSDPHDFQRSHLRLAPHARCGAAGAPSQFNITQPWVLQGQRFVAIGQDPVSGQSALSLPVDAKVLAVLRECAYAMASQTRAMPFETIEFFAGEQQVLSVRRTAHKRLVYERDLFPDNPLSHIQITPKPGRRQPFSVEARAIFVMHCDYEGPHIELDNWKRAMSASVSLPRQNQVFTIGSKVLNPPRPRFPRYTQTELRRAIHQSRGQEPGLASVEEAAPCAPFLRGHRFVIRYGSRVVQEISILNPGGC